MIAYILCALTKCISGLNVRWEGVLPEEKQRVYFANHTSHLDFMSLWAVLPGHLKEKTRPVAARDYWDKGCLRRYIARRVIHAVLINRHISAHQTLSENPVEKMIETLDAGYSLIIFPEGTRGNGEKVQPFKSGLYHLISRRPQVEYVPVYLENLNRILPKGEFFPIPLLGSVTFGAPVVFISDEEKTVFLERARLAVERLGAYDDRH